MANSKKKVSNSLLPKKRRIEKKPIPVAEKTTPTPTPTAPTTPTVSVIAPEATHKTTLRLNKRLHRAASIFCLNTDRSLTGYVEELLRKDLKKNNINV